MHPQPSSQLRRWLMIEAWLLAAERQQEAAGKGRAALSVIAFGRCPEGAYIVYPWRAASLEPLVEALKPTGDRVRDLAKVLLGGLAEWESTFEGPHGELKSSNVFLDGSGTLATRSARFSDPSIAGDRFLRGWAKASTSAINDFRRLGLNWRPPAPLTKRSAGVRARVYFSLCSRFRKEDGSVESLCEITVKPSPQRPIPISGRRPLTTVPRLAASFIFLAMSGPISTIRRSAAIVSPGALPCLLPRWIRCSPRKSKEFPSLETVAGALWLMGSAMWGSAPRLMPRQDYETVLRCSGLSGRNSL